MGKNWTYINPKNECDEVISENMWDVAYHDVFKRNDDCDT